MGRRKALVAGALGIVGSNICEHLARAGDWEVVGIARGRPQRPVAHELVALDLRDTDACARFVADHADTTHLFYAARAADPDPIVETPVNRRMLANLVEPLARLALELRHVSMMHGTKWYGSHFGPYRTPAREDDPRHFPPNFYFDQLDDVAAHQRGRDWTWSALRPHVVCGFSLGYPHNIVSAIGAYAAICKALGLPLRFPGTAACFDSINQATDVRLLADATVWAATEPRCANQSFNVVNGDLFRWRHLWERLAAYFDMEAGGVQTIPLARLMADKEPVWREIVERHGLRPLTLAEIANWRYADMILSQGWDQISSPTKARSLGFDGFIDTEAMFVEHLDRYRAERVLP